MFKRRKDTRIKPEYDVILFNRRPVKKTEKFDQGLCLSEKNFTRPIK